MAMSGVAGILAGLAVAVYIVNVLFTALNLNTGLYLTVTSTVLPLVVFIAAFAIALDFLGNR